MTYKGLFKPKNPSKYKGNINEIVYRSSWEKKMMIYCDTTKSVVEWGSEELVIPYVSPWDGRYHRYFPDFYVKVKDRSGKLQKYIIEVIFNIIKFYNYIKYVDISFNYFN